MTHDLSNLPPVAREFPKQHKHHGVIREDPWHWLSERENEEVLSHLKAENAHTEQHMTKARIPVETIYRELLGRVEESNQSAPYRQGRYIYESRIQKGQNYRMYFRKPVDEGSDWECFFDANKEAEEQAYFDLGFLDVSPDERILAYAIDTEGEESYTLKFKNLQQGEDLPVAIEDVSAEGEWDATGKAFFFLKEDETRRPDRIFRFPLGTDPANARLVYEEKDPLFYVGIYKSQDEAWIFASSESKETTEISYLSADHESGEFKLLYPRREGIQYWVEHQHEHWLIRTNDDAPDFKLLSAPVVEPDLENAKTLIPARPGVRLNEVLPLNGYQILFTRQDGLDHIIVHDLANDTRHEIEVPDEVYDLEAAMNAEFDTPTFNFTYSSPIRPSLTYEYNLSSRDRKIIHSIKIPSGHDPKNYSVYRIKAPSHDGVEVPMTVLHRKDLPLDGSRPAFLYAYGAYGSSVDTDFRSSWLTWLERGFTVAIAHVRGGGYLGEHWYQAGKLENKKNTFLDFIAAAEALVSNGYSQPDRLLIEGGSAGGLLIGAVLNLRPDLFKAAVAAVPFVDVVSTMLDPGLPLTTFEYEEWGNPQDKAVFETLMAYSPYDNVRSTGYPALLVTAGFNDPRVPYWEAAKWVAKIRKHHTDTSPILLKTQLDSGHAGASGRYEFLKEIALEQAFLLNQLPLEEIPD